MAKKVLVTDDSLLCMVSLRDLLESRGYEVIPAEDGESALQVVTTHRPDIALLDTCLPGMNGYELCEKLRKIFGRRIKIIVYTGQINAVDAGKAIKAGADDYVVKTSDFSLLLSAIERVAPV